MHFRQHSRGYFWLETIKVVPHTKDLIEDVLPLIEGKKSPGNELGASRLGDRHCDHFTHFQELGWELKRCQQIKDSGQRPN